MHRVLKLIEAGNDDVAFLADLVIACLVAALVGLFLWPGESIALPDLGAFPF